MTQQQLIEAIEPMIDATDLATVLLAIARICNEKSEHIRCNWQDNLAAKRWDQAAAKIDKVAGSIPA